MSEQQPPKQATEAESNHLAISLAAMARGLFANQDLAPGNHPPPHALSLSRIVFLFVGNLGQIRQPD